MIYADWFFCHQVRMVAKDAADYLEALYFISENTASIAEKKNALKYLETAEALLQGYAIPVLVRQLLSEEGRAYINSKGVDEEKGKYVGRIKGILVRAAETDEMMARFVEDLDVREYEQVAEVICEILMKYEAKEGSGEKMDYLETDLKTKEILALSILRMVAEVVPEQVSGFVRGENQLPFLKGVLDGGAGQLAWNLALETMGICQEPVVTLIGLFPEKWFTQPDLMELMARIKYGDNVALMIEESYKFSFLRENFRAGVEYYREFWVLESTNNDDFVRSCAIMWQGVLWMLVLKSDKKEGTRHLEEIWRITGNSQNKKRLSYLNFIVKKFMSDQETSYEQSQVIRFTACPWVRHDEEGKVSNNFRKYAKFGQNYVALRIFSAILIMRIWLNGLPYDEITSDMVHFLLHWGTLMGLSGAKKFFRKPDAVYDMETWTPWSSAVGILGVYADRVLLHIGMGKMNRNVPDRIVYELENVDSDEIAQEPELDYLYQRDAFQSAAHWAYLALSERKAVNLADTNPWFNGGNSSCAALLCQKIFGKEREIPASRDALMLAYQEYPGKLPDEPNKWTQKYKGSVSSKIGTPELIRERRPAYDEWGEMGELFLERFLQDAPKLALTMRLCAAYPTELIGREHPWFLEWQNCIAAIQQETEFSTLLRYELLKLFEIIPGHLESRESLMESIQLVIQAINEFTTGDAVYYQALMANKLRQPNDFVGERAYDQLRIQFMEELSDKLYRSLERSWDDGMEKQNYILLSFLMWMKTRLAVSENRLTLNRYWNRKNIVWKQARFRQLDEISAKQVLNCCMWIKKEEEICAVWRDHELRKNYYDVVSLFEKKGEVKEDCLYRAVIVGRTFSRDKTDFTFQINYGAGDLVDMNTTDRRMLIHKPGDSVFIRFRSGKVDRIYGNAFHPEDGDRIVAEKCEIEGSEIKVCVMNNSETIPGKVEYMNSWCPDLSMIIGGKSLSVENCLVERRNGVYLPAVRDFSQLIVERFFSGENSRGGICLSYIGRTVRYGKEIWLFSYQPGINYGLFRENLNEKCRREIEGRMSGTEGGAGLIVHVKLEERPDGIPELSLCGNYPIDDKNIRWKDQFAEEEQFVISRNKDGNWFVRSRVPEILESIEVDVSLAGMNPKTIREADKLNVQIEGWDEYDQRKAKVRASVIKSRSLKSNLVFEELDELVHIKAGDFLTLGYVNCSKMMKGYHFALTDARVAVRCAAESFSAKYIKKEEAGRLFENRACIVEYVDLKSYREENASLRSCSLKELECYTGCLNGIMAEIPDDIQNQMLEATVFLAVNERIVYVKAPLQAFSPLPNLVGEPVEAQRNGENWIFRVKPRTIYVRALWELENHKAENGAAVKGMAVGYAGISGMGMGMLTQDSVPILHFYKQESIVASAERGVNGKLKGRGGRMAYRKCATSIFRNTYMTSVVKVMDDQQKQELIGEAGSDVDIEHTLEWRVRLDVNYMGKIRGKLYYDLRRVFIPVCDEAGSGLEKQEEEKEAQIKRYLEWCDAGEFHATGSKKIVDGQEFLALHNLSVPADVNQADKNDVWEKIVKLKEGEQPLLLGRPYKTGDMRVRLLVEGNRWIASYHQAEPMKLNTAFAEYFNASYGNDVEQTLYYVYTDENDRLWFEWGYGYSLAVRNEDVTDTEGNLIGRELFLGDKIIRFRLEEAGGEFGWKMRVSAEGRFHELEYRVAEDSQRDAIQLLQIHKVPEQNKVFIQQVSVLAREIGKGGWSFENIRTAKLDEESIAKILQEEGEENRFILARMKLDERPERMTSLKFSYISLDKRSAQDEVLENKVVCLVAGKIRDGGKTQGSKIINDWWIDFYLPNELPSRDEKLGEYGTGYLRQDGGKRPHMKVEVARRQFSLDESWLRVALRESPYKYYGYNMLVRLGKRNEKQETSWNGYVKTTPLRSEKCLREWVASRKTCLAVLGDRMKDSKYQMEISPGILGAVDSNDNGKDFRSGDLAALRIKGGRVVAETILPGDLSYLEGEGRPVELLIMDNALNKFYLGKALEETEPKKAYRSKYDFTVAGFPQIRFQNRELLENAIRSRPPRFAWLALDERSNVRIIDGKKIRAAYLDIDEKTKKPILVQMAPDEKRIQTEWSQISFKDGTIEEILVHVKRGKWHYHDKRTGVWNEKDGKMQQLDWPLGDHDGEVSFHNAPLFLDERGCLRYRGREIRQYCYSAHEICENGLPEIGGWYPVAESDKDKIWIEIMPGKILDIPRKYLFGGERGKSLALMCTSIFQAGDELKLGEMKDSSDSRSKILVESVKFGMRFAFKGRNAWLPVAEVRRGGVAFGGGYFTIMLPVSNTEGWKSGELGCIGRNNTVSLGTEGEKPQRGEVVLLSFNENRQLEIQGMPSIIVKPAYENLWRDVIWLRSYLWNRKNAAGNLFCDGIPMVINNIMEENGETRYFLFYPQPIPGKLEEGTQLCCNILGEMIDDNGERQVVLRAGGYLFHMKGKELWPGLSERDQGYVCRTLAEKRTVFWVHRTLQGWKSGLEESEQKDDIRVEMLACVSEAKGILCRDYEQFRLWWLPVEQTARVDRVLVEEVFETLKSMNPQNSFIVRIMEDGTISLIHTDASNTRYAIMEAGNNVYRMVPRLERQEHPEGYYTYLGELYPGGDIVNLVSERVQNFRKADPIPVNIRIKREGQVLAVPAGMQRIRICLSPWILKACRENYVDKQINFATMVDSVPPRYADYDQAVQKAIEDSMREVCRLPEGGPEVTLVYLCSLLLNCEAKRERSKQLYTSIFSEARKNLSIWLRGVGHAIAVGFDQEYSYIRMQELDLLPTIAAIMLLNRIKRNEADCKKLAVHLTRMVGMLCNNSMYQELLISRWLLQKKQIGHWGRLSGLSLGGETVSGDKKEIFDGTLTNMQYKKIVRACEGIRNKNNCPEELRFVAESLLFSLGAKEDYSELYGFLKEKAYLFCGNLAHLGRALYPGLGKMTAMEKLNDPLVDELRKCYRRMTRRGSIQVTLIADNVYPVDEEQKKWAAELCKNIL